MILIKNGYIVEKKGFYDILIENNIIKRIDKKIECRDCYTIEAKNHLVVPAFCNAHTHLAMSLFRGLADDLALMSWLNDYIFPNEAKYVNKDMVYKCSKLSMLEMLRSGTGCFMDMYFFEEEVARAAHEIGIRGVIGEGIVDFESPSCRNADVAISKTKSLKEEFESDMLKVSFAPHSTYTLSNKSLKKIADAADQSILQVHASETKDEVDIVLKDKGKTPIEVLKDVGLLNHNTYLAHCVEVSYDDINLIQQAGSSVVINPQSNMKLGNGIVPLVDMTKHGINILIGTDSSASNNSLDIVQELKAASLANKVLLRKADVANAEEMFKIGTNARSLFDNTGGIKEGYKADLSLISADPLNAVPMYNPYSHILYSLNSKDIDAVVINGKVIMEHSEFKDIDENKIKDDVRNLAKDLGAIF